MPDLILPHPIGKQPDWLISDHSRKVLRVGRRGSKTRFAFTAALAGHGPGWMQGTPKYKGVLAGGDVVWIAQNYANLSTVLWREEILPRMAHLPHVKLDSTRHDVNISRCGALLLRSGDREAIDSVRGIGKRLNGVIVDEAAWLDLRGALQDVILPALLDNDGWLILMSTTNAGKDGGYDDQGAPQIPSYFNAICQEIRSGARGKEWVEFTGTAYDNPVMTKESIDALVAEYAPDSPKLRQEVFAELLESGVGLAFPQLDARHWVEEEEGFSPAGPAEWFGGFDWGYAHPWALPYGWRDSDGQVIVRDTLWGRQDSPEEISRKVDRGLAHPVRAIWAGRDTWGTKGKSLGLGDVTIGLILGQSGLPFVQASADTKESNVSGVDNLRRYLAWEQTDTQSELALPRLRFCRTEGNQRLVSQLSAMQLDPGNPENVLKVDADYVGRGGDDGYEALRRMMQAYPLTVSVPKRRAEDVPVGTSAGYDYEKRQPRQRETGEQSLARLFEQAQPVNPLAGRHRLPRR